LKKRTKKTFSNVVWRNVQAGSTRAADQAQKFFDSFFQKGTLPFPSLLI
jgi:hypothetical protein